ncbi:MAG: carbon-phosphorus lyase [Paenibacillus sp.]|jgi:alpha-D-ribose 1-methylphosphonate 5-triphosphate synthase subunit PhnI|nr:carbon-phosphorus lyase [Paenibacillus sp.]
MAYVAVTGGQEAIAEANSLVQYYRVKGSPRSMDIELMEKQLRLLVDRVMGEGGIYAPEYAAIALKQAEGDPAEAAFLLRAYRSTLPRNHYSLTVEPADMRVIRRISSSFRDVPGGQILGPTYDYTHRMLNFSLRHEGDEEITAFVSQFAGDGVHQEGSLTLKKVADLLREQGLMAKVVRSPAAEQEEPFDITRQKMTIPSTRAARLQTLARGETGAMTALAYSSMRGYGVVHPTVGELRVGYSAVHIPHPYSQDGEDDPVYIGEMMLTEVETINSFKQDAQSGDVQFLLGYGLCFGQNEVKGISMAILERSLETAGTAPAQDEEFVLTHIDSVESNGFVSHLKLPHYITFQSSLDQIRKVQVNQQEKAKKKEEEQHAADATNREAAQSKDLQHSSV